VHRPSSNAMLSTNNYLIVLYKPSSTCSNGIDQNPCSDMLIFSCPATRRHCSMPCPASASPSATATGFSCSAVASSRGDPDDVVPICTLCLTGLGASLTPGIRPYARCQCSPGSSSVIARR